MQTNSMFLVGVHELVCVQDCERSLLPGVPLRVPHLFSKHVKSRLEASSQPRVSQSFTSRRCALAHPGAISE